MDLSKFSQNAREVMDVARAVVRRGRSNHLGTEHLLLGLLAQQEGVVHRVFEEFGLDLFLAQSKTNDAIRRRDLERLRTSADRIQLTLHARRALECASEEAAYADADAVVRGEHLLLALMMVEECTASEVLWEVGLSEADARRVVKRVRQEEEGGVGGDPDSLLYKHGRDVTRLAREGKLDPVVAREGEIKRVIQILTRRTKNNPALVGEPGVGKTAIIEGFAQRIAEGHVPEALKDKVVVALDLGSLVAGTRYRGEFEERLKGVVDEVKSSYGRVILFVDEMHNLVETGGGQGSMDAGEILKPALARNELAIIGATTIDEYRRHVEPDAAFERRFSVVLVEEPTEEETVEILRALKSEYEEHHGVKISEEALSAAASLSHRYVSERFLPDKAIDLLDEAASRLCIETTTIPDELRKLEERLQEELARESEVAIEDHDYAQITALREETEALREEYEQARDRWLEESGAKDAVVGREEVARVVSDRTGIPVGRMLKSEVERLLWMEAALHRRVVGQDTAVVAIAEAVRKARAGMANPERPIGSFIFLGPTGVGKTELARALAEYLFDDEDAAIRLDMSEYMERHAASRLVGAPPGYVGYEEGGQLTEAVRRRPYSVVLLDEIEKAHPDVFNILLQLLEDGRLTDNKGRTVSFNNAMIIMTSNVGAHLIPEPKEMRRREDEIHDRLMQELRACFRPEFLNRVDEIIVFHALSDEELTEIAGLLLNNLCKTARRQEIQLTFSDVAKKHIASEGRDSRFGARPLRRAVSKLIESPLSKEIITGRIGRGDTVLVDVNPDGHIVFEHETTPAEPLMELPPYSPPDTAPHR